MRFIDLTESDDGGGTLPAFAIDLVFVHGLREAGLKAWTDADTGALWMRDLFPHKKYGARNLICEYDATRLVTPGGPSTSGIYDEASELIHHLSAMRTDAESRPIVFICHEIGGLIVKRALAFSQSRRDAKLAHIRSIHVSTYGVIFMATPHRGFSKDALLLWNQEHNYSPNQFMLSLLYDSEALQEIADQFATLVRRLAIYNLWERKKTKLGEVHTYIVDQASAAPSWEDVDQCGIDATHSEMTKFSSRKSPGYRLVIAALERYTTVDGRDSVSVVSTPSREPHPLRTNVHYCVQGRRSEPYYIGRQQQADHLELRLGATDSDDCQGPKVFVIHGLPGSGKSQFCLKYIEKVRNRYWGIFWIDCSSVKTAEDGFASLGQLGGKGTEPGSGQVWLTQTTEPWLLVLDNADDSYLLGLGGGDNVSGQTVLTSFIPASGNGHVLITSRNPGAKLYSTLGSFDFRGLLPKDAITLLLRLAYPDKNQQETWELYSKDAEAIASELGHLALALKQAAATIRKNVRPLKTYLDSLLGCRTTLLKRTTIKNATVANIVATWELPFNGIANRDSTEYRDAVDLIHMFAFMHFSLVPCSVFSICSDGFKGVKDLNVRPRALTEPTSRQMVQDRILAAARVLYDHSIISITETESQCVKPVAATLLPETCFTLHPAIHQWARERLDESEQLGWLRCTATVLEHAVSTNMEASGRGFRRLLLPHIRSCMSLMPGLPWTSEQKCQFEKFGYVFAEAGLWKLARRLQQHVMNHRARTLGQSHPSTIVAKQTLASTQWNLFDVEESVKLLRNTLRAQRWSRPSILDWLVWPPWKPVYVSYCVTLDALTQSLWLAGHREWSLMTGQRAVDGLMRQLGSDDPLTLSAMFNLARTHLHMNEHDQSTDMLEQILAKREHYFGPDHPDTLMVRNELDMAKFSQKKDLHEAERLVRGVLESRQRILGEEHAYSLWSVNDVSKVCIELGRLDEARNMLEEIVPVVSRTLGDKHVGMVMTKSNLFRVYLLCNMWDKAKKEMEDLLAIFEETSLHQEHPDYVLARLGRAYLLYEHEKNSKEAERICQGILSQVDKRKLSPESPRVTSAARLLIRVCREQGRDADIKDLEDKFPLVNCTTSLQSIDHLPLSTLGRRRSSSDRRTDCF
ncbi:hypothetical protein ED733_002087 [Metarhizium rileyi]|uniref:Uncharacterized protein n=1 Tax=Metarhizium rileyi (strain RCEF 4871) TaxID=1649241 RepID=A0A5C6G3D6_METRR|nr:hypothetical protein ED733_002087 [Metarhizium rileyi]